MIIPYEIGDVYTRQCDNGEYRISGLTVKANKSIKIRLTDLQYCVGSVHEMHEVDFLEDYRKKE